MFYVSSAMRERASRFDVWRAHVDTALREPAVREQLSALGARLLLANQEQFLPNVRHGQVSVPFTKRNTNQTVLLPRLSADEVLSPTPSLLLPTPQRKKQIQTALAQRGHESSNKRALKILTQRALGYVSKDNTVSLNVDRPTTTCFATDEVEGIHYASRPVVALDHTTPGPLPQLNGTTGAHELVHVIDITDRPNLSDNYFAPRTEARGYQVGITILGHAIDTGQIALATAQEHMHSTLVVNNLLAEYDIDADALLNGHVPDDQLDDLACDLLWRGYLETD